MKRILSLLLIFTLLSCGAASAAGIPSVHVDGIDNGAAIAYGEEVAVTVSAYGDFTKVFLYLNGEECASTAEGEARFVLSDVPSGRNVISAEVVDDTGNAFKGNEIVFYYILSQKDIISNDDFETETDGSRSNGWDIPNVPAITIDEAENDTGYSLILDTGNSAGQLPAKADLKSNVCNNLSANGFTFEFDTQRIMKADDGPVVFAKVYIKTNNGDVSLGGIRRDGGSTGTYVPSITLRDLPADNDVFPAIKTANKTWYHIKYEINLAKGTAEMFYAVGKGNNSNMSSIGVRNFVASSSLLRLYFEYNGYATSADSNPKLMIDNISFSEIKKSAYLNKPTFYMGDVVFDGDFIPPNPFKMTVPFSTDMDSSTVTKDAFTLISGDKKIEIEDVMYDEASKTAAVVFKKPLNSNTFYKLIVNKNVKTCMGMTQPTDLITTFKTSFNDFDVTSINVMENGIPVSANEMTAGDTYSFEYTVQNQTDAEINGALIFAVYENDALAYINMQPAAVDPFTQKKTFVSTADYVCNTEPDSVEVYFWRSMTERLPLIQARVLK